MASSIAGASWTERAQSAGRSDKAAVTCGHGNHLRIRQRPGASRGTVIGMIMREMLAVILAGLAAGVAGAYLSGRYVETQLFGVKSLDGRC